VAEQVAGLEPRHFTYDTAGRLSTITQGPRTAVLAYDAQGSLASITDPLGRAVHFAYDAAGRLTRQTLPDGREVRYSYDANGNLTALTPPGRPLHAFTYTPVDLQEDYVPPNVGAGTTLTHYAYNLHRQLVQVTRPDGATISLGYDAAGRLSTLTLPRGQVRYTYDPATGNLSTLTDPDGETLTYRYDGNLLTNTTWSGAVAGSVQRTYDNNFRLTAERVNGGHTIDFQYDADGLLTDAGALHLSRDLHNGLLTGSTLATSTDARTYNSFGELDSYRATVGGSDIFMTEWERDDLGRITQKTDTIDGQTSTLTYGYDLAGRLSEVTQDGTTVATYTYDANGNRLSASGPGGMVTDSYDAQDRLLQYGATTYTYTANGELQSKTTGGQTTTYAYDALGNLLAVTLPDSTPVEYIVDGQQRRVGKKVSGTLVQGFLYADALRPVVELDGSGAVVARFIYATKANVPDYIEKDGATYRILTDHLGSPRLVVDITTGAIVQRMDYDAFGQVLIDTNPGFQPFGFAGGLYDQDTRLTRFGARDYDAAIGRWTVKDPILFTGGDTNLYGYILNDPINPVDPHGLQAAGEGACRTRTCTGVARFSAVGPNQATGEGALSGFGIDPNDGTVAVGPTSFGLPFPEGARLTAAQRAQREQTKRRLADAAGQITITPQGLNLHGGPVPPYTVGDIGDRIIRQSNVPRFDIYGFPSQQAAQRFGVQDVQTTITIPATLQCPPGFQE